MTNRPTRRRDLTRTILAVGLITAPLWFFQTGCGQEEPPPEPPRRPQREAPPPDPDPVDIEAVRASLDPDPRVQFAQDYAPVDRELAEAVFGLAEAIVQGDDERLREMIDRNARRVLDTLLDTGGWARATSDIESVRVVYMDSSARRSEDVRSGNVVLAVRDRSGAMVTNWGFMRAGGQWVFTNDMASAETRPTAGDWDGESYMVLTGQDMGMDDFMPEGFEGFDPSMIEDMSQEELERMREQLREMGIDLDDIPTAPTGDEAEEGEEQPQRERGPRQRSTPRGPVTIPGSS